MAQPPAAPPMLPAWLDGHLRNIVNAIPRIHFEHSMYGPLNAYLQTFFPPDRAFMIKPQGMLRPELHPFRPFDAFSDIGDREDVPRLTEAEILNWTQGLKEGDQAAAPRPSDEAMDMQIDEENFVPAIFHRGPGDLDIFQNMDGSDEDEPDTLPDPNISSDSYGVEVKRTNRGNRYPDFIVVKGTDGLNGDRILLIVEVKKGDDSLVAARMQIELYLTMAADKRRVPFLQGLLVMGATTECYFLDSLDGNPGDVSNPVQFLTTGMALQTRIHGVAVANWRWQICMYNVCIIL
ncbi:hypothetical protein LshimejAT787_0606220 [Lyophyllum shimeji]|uniref:Uncharacterized protein n=1 Tax=Lyophyllum shimeji TaxID=47721 RepID=A0A9P3UPV6_LYOSH|nr:hypothetical protein LshimejAT787_0606220 [Lyophyllum shimeji]